MSQNEQHVHFDECDPAGIVFFGNFFRLAHRAIEEYLPTVGIPWNEWFLGKGYAAPLVHAEADYKSPLFQGEKYKASVQLQKMGESSVTFTTTFAAVNGRLCATVTTVHAFIDTKTKTKIAIPSSIRDALTRQMP
jgi:acyl-CoA thioester hydrolase/1,4-dihydroxy-2-naphthoyl-CoA hydrolase